jgi:hypothetical protein
MPKIKKVLKKKIKVVKREESKEVGVAKMPEEC